MRDRDIEYSEDTLRCVEYILENKAGWTDFTRWYTQDKGVGHTKANRAWKKAIAAITEQFKDEIENNVSSTLIELENLKQRARQENDRRNELDAIKYQSKLKGLEVERQQVEHRGDMILNIKWGSDDE